MHHRNPLFTSISLAAAFALATHASVLKRDVGDGIGVCRPMDLTISENGAMSVCEIDNACAK